MQMEIKNQRFCDREFTANEVLLIREVVETCKGISRNELALTICELLEWKRPNGRFKSRECQDLLETLENKAILELPEKRPYESRNPVKQIKSEHCVTPYSKLSGSVEDFNPLDIKLVQTRDQRQLFKDLVSSYHYLGYTTPYGARLQYLVYVNRPDREIVGCVQFSSPAWRMKARDKWIGWNDKRRKTALQQVVNNSRFLILANIRNLASTMLSGSLKRLRSDWQKRYCVTPLLVETLVDRQRFYGGCYKASNWLELGETSGRGRMDREHQRHGAQVKTVLVYPLVKNAINQLREGR